MIIIRLDLLLQTQFTRAKSKVFQLKRIREVLDRILWVKPVMGRGEDTKDMESVQKAITVCPRVMCTIQH